MALTITTTKFQIKHQIQHKKIIITNPPKKTAKTPKILRIPPHTQSTRQSKGILNPSYDTTKCKKHPAKNTSITPKRIKSKEISKHQDILPRQ